jgi:hypothetical protein
MNVRLNSNTRIKPIHKLQEIGAVGFPQSPGAVWLSAWLVLLGWGRAGPGRATGWRVDWQEDYVGLEEGCSEQEVVAGCLVLQCLWRLLQPLEEVVEVVEVVPGGWGREH